MIKLRLETPQETFEFGKLLGKYLIAGDIVALIGDLGTGKTQLAKGLARGLSVPEEYYITSPTFTIINEYQGNVPFYHFDLYRLEGEKDLEGLGYEEYFEGKGVAIIEWAEKIVHLLPENHLEIRISHIEENVRELKVSGDGDHYNKIIDKIAHLFSQY